MSKSRLENVSVSKIRVGEIALRAADQDSQQFIELRDSIASRGIINPISLRPKVDPESKEEYFELIDGAQRFAAAKALGLETVPANILDQDDEQVMITQIVANAKRVETKPVDYQQQLLKVLVANPTMTEAELAYLVSASPDWIGRILRLGTLHDNAKPLVNEGKIPLSNAFVLAKLPKDIQLEYLTDAQTKATAEFSGPVLTRVKQIKAAERSGKDGSEAVFEPTPRLRKLTDVQAEIDKREAAKQLVETLQVKDKDSALAGFILGLQWAAKLDPESISVAKNEHDARVKAETEAKARREADRAAKRLRESEDRTAKAKADAEEAEKKAAVVA